MASSDDGSASDAILLELLVSVGLCTRERQLTMQYGEFVHLLIDSVNSLTDWTLGEGKYATQWRNYIARGGVLRMKEFEHEEECAMFCELLNLLRSELYDSLLQ